MKTISKYFVSDDLLSVFEECYLYVLVPDDDIPLGSTVLANPPVEWAVPEDHVMVLASSVERPAGTTWVELADSAAFDEARDDASALAAQQAIDAAEAYTPPPPGSGNLKIFRYMPDHELSDKSVVPHEVDYITGLDRRLYRKETTVFGELRKVEFFANYTPGTDSWPTYSDKIIEENITYVRDSVGFAKERTTVITWFCEDGSPHASTKSLHKPYSPVESQIEGEKRRGGIVSELAVQVAGMLVATVPTSATYPDAQSKIDIGRDFIQANKESMDMFVFASKKDVLYVLRDATETWLDNIVAQDGTTIRDVMIGSMNIWGIVL